MIKVKIGKKKFKIPQYLHELKLKEGRYIDGFLDSVKKIKRNHKQYILAILMGIDYELLNIIEDESINKLYDKLDFINKKPNTCGDKFIKISNKKYIIIDFDKIMCGQMCELDLFIKDNTYMNMHKIVNILLRPVNDKNEDLTEFYDINLRFDFVYYICKLFILWKAELRTEYPTLFNNDENMDEEEEITDTEEEDEDDESELIDLGDIWGTYHYIFDICDGQQDLIDLWMLKMVRELYFTMSYIKQRNAKIKQKNGR